MIENNIRAGFRGAGLVPHDPQAVISKLDIKLRTPSPTRPPPADADPWVSQTPHNPTQALSQTDFVKRKIAGHQGSSPTPIFAAVGHLAKGMEELAHQNTLLLAECHTHRRANEALSKRRRAKRTRVQHGGALVVEDAWDIVNQKEVDEQVQADKRAGSGATEAGRSTARHCSNCGKTGHNTRTCKVDAGISHVHSDD